MTPLYAPPLGFCWVFPLETQGSRSERQPWAVLSQALRAILIAATRCVPMRERRTISVGGDSRRRLCGVFACFAAQSATGVASYNKNSHPRSSEESGLARRKRRSFAASVRPYFLADRQFRHSERSEESRFPRDAGEILRCAQNDRSCQKKRPHTAAIRMTFVNNPRYTANG